MKRLIEIAGTSKKSDIAIDLNVGASTVTNWAKRGVSKEGALAAAKKYKADANYILNGEVARKSKPSIDELKAQISQIQKSGGESITPSGTQKVSMNNLGDVPIISWVAAGSWTSIEPVTLEDRLGGAPRPSNLSKNGFALIVRGRSMQPKYDPGDIIYVEPEVGLFSLKDGNLVVVQCNDDTEATFKQLVIGDTLDDMYLKPLNPDWPDQEMRPMGECTLVGKVIGKFVAC
ncbi:S24 family peptidase [Psychrobacter pygoscelis]|uniref:S24 family peptidase n=1 Tax=Psychrobacter pygoscelis TaxID=2488563 RepID=UPI001F6027B1|nr:S24 family peptidase [Psychrobacter pygoscelis]